MSILEPIASDAVKVVQNAAINDLIQAVNSLASSVAEIATQVSALGARIDALPPVTTQADTHADLRADLDALRERLADAYETQARGGLVTWQK